MKCPRDSGWHEHGDMKWEVRAGQPDTYCNYCGSQHPDAFMRDALAGVELTPTDKSYKVYGKNNQKFYFAHLSEEQRSTFINLFNAGVYNIAFPGHFYVPPFFTQSIN